MIIHLLRFTDKAQLVSKLTNEGVQDKFKRLHKFLSQDEEGQWRWDESRICLSSVIMQEAVWDNTDSENPVLVSLEKKASGLFVMLALDRLSKRITDAAICYLAYDGDTGKIKYRDAAVTDALLAKVRFSPVLAGTVEPKP